jgi:alkanesulfonate monooxygenase SsuD/methylene tetrahydromethanopterin reductase-like flavin-dependent oxidoreductase (luciferase family)
VARHGDGWLASAYNTTPAQVAEARMKLGKKLSRAGKQLDGFPCSLATIWTYVTGDRSEQEHHLHALERMLNRPKESLGQQVLVGPAEACADTLRSYADAGIDVAFIWPVGNAEKQLERFMREVAPLV